MRRRKTDHVVAGHPDDPTVTAWCRNCGEKLRLGLPMEVSVWVAAIKAHADCVPRRQSLPPQESDPAAGSG